MVLVVDDDPWIRSLIADVLVDEGFRVQQASDGGVALSLAQQLRPDVIVLDVALPTRSGLAILKALKEAATTCQIPVIMTSGYDLQALDDDLGGAAGFLSKPFDIADLLACVRQQAGKSSAARAMCH
jgi:DNA-binding response OmpR family regulator